MFCGRQHQLFTRAGNTDITQSAFFFEFAFFFQRTLAGKQTFFEADDEHQRKLQTFGAVQGHHLHAVVPGGGLTFMSQKSREHIHVFVFHRIELKTARGGDQLFQVFYPRLAFFGFFLAVKFNQSAFVNHMTDPFIQFEAIGIGC